MINVQVTKQASENPMSTIRRFTKRVQGSGVLRRARSIKYQQRSLSKFTKKTKALNRIKKRENYETLLKLGKITQKKGRRR